jgi:hypothetical protein
VKVDLHCHSSISDGLLSPTQLVQRAADNGVQLLALTDHDDVSGLAEARLAADEHGIRFIDGVEVSVTWEDTSIHVVGLGVDPSSSDLSTGLAEVRSGRGARARRMANALESIGIAGTLEGASRYAKNPNLIGRTHFARYLVEQRIVADIKSAFDHYLVRGKPGFVPHLWAALGQAVGWIDGAGGIAVLAHPGRYRLSTKQRQSLFEEFKACGGRGIEVMSGAHGPQQEREFAAVARRFGFAASRASDFHGPGESRVDLGGTPELPEDLQPIWKTLL